VITNKYKISCYDKLTRYRKKVYISLFKDEKGSVLLGCGCAGGALTLKIAKIVEAKTVIGVDLDKTALAKAKARGIKTIESDLNRRLPLESNSCDVIHADQVIEHLSNIDGFVKEIYRILKPGGFGVFSTENLSSWHNLFALVLGKQAFSQHISSKFFLGNPFSPHYKEKLNISFPHIHIFTIQGLKDLFETYGFVIDKIKGIGYSPFPPSIGKILEICDPTHSYFLAIKVRKPKS